MDRRTQLLSAAAHVYARYGYRGSTTRRIADEAGVNEVTIFRQFGTKDALIHEAIATCGGGQPILELPAIPIDPVAELTTWSEALTQHLRSMRSMIRRCMSESEEHPQLGNSSNAGPVRASTQLWAYLSRLREHGFVDEDFDVKAAAAMLIGAVFADAMGRDVMPDIFPPSSAAEVYSRFLLRAIGICEQASPRDAVFNK
jgi:AcrR family transcriptional regulator